VHKEELVKQLEGIDVKRVNPEPENLNPKTQTATPEIGAPTRSTPEPQTLAPSLNPEPGD